MDKMSERESEAMDDLEMVLRCYDAMGDLPAIIMHEGEWRFGYRGCYGLAYNPLKDDAQAMALVKKFDLEIRRPHSDEWWLMGNGLYGASVGDADLNRAIVRCVSVMFGENDER